MESHVNGHAGLSDYKSSEEVFEKIVDQLGLECKTLYQNVENE